MRDKARILVADDDPLVLELFTTLLADQGYDVHEATTGKECLDAARSHHPDIVLLDVMLPDMTGVEVCRQIKAESGLQGTYVILVSGARVSSEYQAEGLDIGADGYIVKGIANREFLARIQSLMRIKRAEDALREKEREQRKLVSELQKALSEIKTLKGLLPICASCKKIRDDEGYWDHLESYVGKRTDAVFSHGICPECAERLYPQYYKPPAPTGQSRTADVVDIAKGDEDVGPVLPKTGSKTVPFRRKDRSSLESARTLFSRTINSLFKPKDR